MKIKSFKNIKKGVLKYIKIFHETYKTVQTEIFHCASQVVTVRAPSPDIVRPPRYKETASS